MTDEEYTFLKALNRLGYELRSSKHGDTSEIELALDSGGDVRFEFKDGRLTDVCCVPDIWSVCVW